MRGFTVVPIGNFTIGTECKYSALYLARKVSAFLLYLLILLLYNNRVIKSNLAEILICLQQSQLLK